jgi:uncharacterized protein (TIGR00255 family)
MSLQSMTGYASAQSQLGATAPHQVGLRLGMEIRSVNSRYLDLSFRLPDELRGQEPALRELISAHVKRGKVELRAHLEAAADAALASPDTAMLQNLVKIQDNVRMWLPHATPLSVAEVMRLASAPPSLSEDVSAKVLALGTSLVTQLGQARAREGQRLAQDLLSRAKQLMLLADQALPLLPQTVELQRQKFLERWREALALAEAHALPEAVHERAMAEAASFAIKADVAEEVTRLKTHLDEISRLLTLKAHKEGVGKRLDFLIQELHREANTLGAKSSAIELTRISLDMKVLIEQMREQVQNLE